MEQERIEVKCKRPVSDFPASAYREDIHRFSNSIVLAPDAFETLNISPYSYVEIRPVGVPNPMPTDLYAIPFSESYENPSIAAIGTNVMREVGITRGESVEIRPKESIKSPELTAYRPYANISRKTDLETPRCFIHPWLRWALGFEQGDDAELYNPETGNRLPCAVYDLLSDDREYEKIRLQHSITEVLGIEYRDRVRLRRPPDISEPSDTYQERAFASLVGYRSVTLRTEPGEDRDEDRDIVRLNEDTVQYLGTSFGDEIELNWKGKRIVAQCLPTKTGTTISPFEIQVPSTIRDRLGLNPNDAVTARRDVEQVFYDRIALSLLGILAVVFSSFQVYNSLDVTTRLESAIGTVPSLLLLSGFVSMISVAVVWLLFLPQRREC